MVTLPIVIDDVALVICLHLSGMNVLCLLPGEGKCDSSQCDDRYTLDSENKCKKCDANCKKCSTPGECDSSQCDDRYVFALKTCHGKYSRENLFSFLHRSEI